jgi:hypothetical protein
VKLAPALLVLASCDRVLGLATVRAIPDAPPPDAPPDAPPCTMPLLHDSFDTAPPCNSWGRALTGGNGSITVANGQLVIQPAPNTIDSQGFCDSTGAAIDFTNGLFVQVTTLPGGDEYMYVRLNWPDPTMSAQYISWNPTSIEFSHGSQKVDVPFDPQATTWVRIRPLGDGTGSAVETSGDGLSWTMFAFDPMPPPATLASLEMIGGVFVDNDPNPLPILFDGLNVCPM